MSVCLIHGVYYNPNAKIGLTYCPDCNRTKQAIVKTEDKISLDKIIEKNYTLHLEEQRKKHTVKGVIVCCTCSTRMNSKSRDLFTMAHWGHWYSKSIYWFFYIHELNGGFQCYECNVVNNGKPKEMEKYLRKTFGDAVIDDFILEVKEWKKTATLKPTEAFLSELKIKK